MGERCGKYVGGKRRRGWKEVEVLGLIYGSSSNDESKGENKNESENKGEGE